MLHFTMGAKIVFWMLIKQVSYFKPLGLSVFVTLLAWSCVDRVVCPAYQSAFIYDKETLVRHFSYFKEDSTPKLLSASKNKFLVAKKRPYWKKMRNLNGVKMEKIYPQLDDSIQLAGDIMLQAEMDVVDSVALDSLVLNEIGWEEHFNVDQEFYFYYLNDILVYPEERLEAQQENAEEEQAEAQRENAEEEQTEAQQENAEEEQQENTEEEQQENTEEEQRENTEEEQAESTDKRQNFFQKFLSIFKKKPKTEENDLEQIEEEGVVEEVEDAPVKDPSEEDDGF